MHSSRIRLAKAFSFLVAAPLVLAVLSALPQHAAPQPPSSAIALGIDPAQSKVHWVLGTTLHAVHGTFAFKNGTLHVDPATGKASGEIAVYATSGDSGNDGRDKKMHKDVLESGKFPEIIFSAGPRGGESCASRKLFGSSAWDSCFARQRTRIDRAGPSGICGRPLDWKCEVQRAIIDWGLKNPSNFFLKVNHIVEIELDLKGSLQNPRHRNPELLL